MSILSEKSESNVRTQPFFTVRGHSIDLFQVKCEPYLDPTASGPPASVHVHQTNSSPPIRFAPVLKDEHGNGARCAVLVTGDLKELPPPKLSVVADKGYLCPSIIKSSSCTHLYIFQV